MIQGFDTPLDWTDDVYQITGSFNGYNWWGTPFTANITTPLIRKMSCHWIDTGVITIVPSAAHNRVLDFGNGTCDNQATVTIIDPDGTPTFNIYLH